MRDADTTPTETSIDLHTVFVRSLENWINDIVRSNPNLSSTQIVGIVNERFQQNNLSNFQFHNKMSFEETLLNDKNIAKYHEVMAAIYTELLHGGQRIE